MNDRVAIEYRDFWDVPRIFFFDLAGRRLLADCTFDNETEDYSGEYVVYEMPPDLRIPDGSWIGIEAKSVTTLGKIAVEKVEFDETKKQSVRADVFRAFL